ncbi:uncharacterized protein LOC119576681 [Penaeus monodon]|uniref:uncharacterized protein LOC119576681 n=1 Tax=Penaeus monodon TaxID=6687 RepID=UPI0018A787EB|nr:uncharacterized protein LOC119576681 [Penaeus monodon]
MPPVVGPEWWALQEYETEVAQRSVARSLTVVLRRHGEISLKWPSRGSATRPTSPTNISKKRCSVLEFGLAQAAWKGPKRERRERVRENQWRLASASGSADGCITESFLLLVPLLLSAGQPHRRSERGRCVWARLSLTSLRRAPAGSGEGCSAHRLMGLRLPLDVPNTVYWWPGTSNSKVRVEGPNIWEWKDIEESQRNQWHEITTTQRDDDGEGQRFPDTKYAEFTRAECNPENTDLEHWTSVAGEAGAQLRGDARCERLGFASGSSGTGRSLRTITPTAEREVRINSNSRNREDIDITCAHRSCGNLGYTIQNSDSPHEPPSEQSFQPMRILKAKSTSKL